MQCENKGIVAPKDNCFNADVFADMTSSCSKEWMQFWDTCDATGCYQAAVCQGPNQRLNDVLLGPDVLMRRLSNLKLLDLPIQVRVMMSRTPSKLSIIQPPEECYN